MQNRYSHILFDLDGTLVDTHDVDVISLYEVVKEYFPDTLETVESLGRVFGLPSNEALKSVGFSEDKIPEAYAKWCKAIEKRSSSVKLFDGVLAVLEILKKRGVKLGIITSRKRSDYGKYGILGDYIPLELSPYFIKAVCSDDVEHPKPYPDSLLKYMQDTGAKPHEILFIGDTKTDLECADKAGVDFALALWGYTQKEHLNCAHYFASPWSVLTAAVKSDDSKMLWFKWAREIQAIGQIGLAYSKDRFDIERFTRLREIALEIMHTYTDAPLQQIKDAFCFDKGYITPKIDTRGAAFDEHGRILLVKETSGLWSMPGGWCEEDGTIFSNVVKELREEACVKAVPYKLVALLDRRRYNSPPLPYGIIKAFVLCRHEALAFVKNNETSERKYFGKDELPLDKLRVDTTSYEQLMMCFAAYENKDWQPIVD